MMAGAVKSAGYGAPEFIRQLKALAVQEDVAQVTRFFYTADNPFADGNRILGVKIGKVFPLAKQFVEMPLGDIEVLLENAYYELRMGAVSIMDFQARAKSVEKDHRKALFDLYLRRHDRINNWDLVDRAAPWVIGAYLADKPRAPLTRLAKSANPWERRTAIVCTWAFIRAGDLADTFRIAGLLVSDRHDMVQKAVGSWLREAGKRDPAQLHGFLDRHAKVMAPNTLRAAVENLAEEKRLRYLGR